MEHRIEIEALPCRVNSGRGNSGRKYRALHDGRELCIAGEPACASARKLLESSVAQRDDVLLLCRGGRVATRGGIGWFADRTVNEVRGDGTPRFAKWTPFMHPDRSKTGVNDDDEAGPHEIDDA